MLQMNENHSFEASTSSGDLNETYFPLSQTNSPGFETLYRVMFIACHMPAATAAIENLVVLILYACRSHVVIHQRKEFTLSLAAADMCVGVTWFLQAYLVNNSEVFSRLLYTIHDGMLAASALSVFIMVLDRLLLVRRPFTHEHKCGKHYVWFGCLGVWVYSLLAGATLSILDANMKQQPRDLWACGIWPVLLVAQITFIFPAFSTLVIFLCLHAMAVRARLKGHQMVPLQQDIGATNRRTIKEAKRSVMLYSTVAFFQLFGGILSEMPNLYIAGLCGVKQTLRHKTFLGYLSALQHVAYLVRATGSAVNPWIHTFRRREIIRCFAGRGSDINLCSGSAELQNTYNRRDTVQRGTSF